MSSGGNPGGFFQIGDNFQFFSYKGVAPASFRGDLRMFDGGTLSFDAFVTPDGSVDNEGFGTVTITGPNGTISRDLHSGAPTPNQWVGYSTGFDAATWSTSQQNWDSIISDVRRMTIEFDAYDGSGETTGLDNVLLPEPGGAAIVALAVMAVLSARRRKRASRASPVGLA